MLDCRLTFCYDRVGALGPWCHTTRPTAFPCVEVDLDDPLTLLPDVLPEWLVEAEQRSADYRALRETKTSRSRTDPMRLDGVLAGLNDDDVAMAVDPLSRRQRRTHAEKQAFATHLRKHMTGAEWLLWEHLEPLAEQGIVFESQYVLRGWIVDFYCAAAKLVIEVDGSVHNGGPQWVRDRQKDDVLRANGYTLVRVQNADVERDPTIVVDRILRQMTHGR